MLLIQIGLDLVDEGPAILRSVVGVHRQPGTLIHQQNVLVLIDDVQLGSRHGQIGVILPGCIEKLIVDVQLQSIPRLQPGVPLGPGSVAFDPLQAYVFLGQGGRQQGHGLGKEPVQPLSGIIGPNRQFLHGLFPSISAKWRLIWSVNSWAAL